jgi:hypothetical protein
MSSRPYFRGAIPLTPDPSPPKGRGVGGEPGNEHQIESANIRVTGGSSGLRILADFLRSGQQQVVVVGMESAQTRFGATQ